MKKKRVFSVLLLIVLTLLMTTSVLAEGNTYTVPVKGQKTGLTSFSTGDVTLSKEPVYAKMSDVTMRMGSKTMAYPIQYGCTLTVPSGTSSVTITLNSTTEGCFFRVYEPSGALDPNAMMNGYASQEEAEDVSNTVTIDLDENGKGKSQVVFPYTYGQVSGTTTYSYSCYGHAFIRFIVETAESKYKFDSNLPENKQYYQLGTEADALTVNVPVSEGESVTYKWYKGTDAGKIDTLVAESATFTPDTSATGITYYQVKATVTPVEGEPEEISSRVMTAVVKDPNLKVSLDKYGYADLKKESDHVFSMKTDSEINVFVPKITGKLPDGITIKAAWSGSPVDRFDLTKQGALTTNPDLNTFTLDLKAAVSDPAVANITFVDNPGYRHVYGRCLYIQTSDNEIYTIVVDSSSTKSIGYKGNLPELVQLTDLDGTVFSDFQVSELQSTATTSAVVHGTISSTTALRAQVKNGGTDPTQTRVNKDTSQYWSEAHQNWIVVNGQPVGGSFYGLAEGFSGNSPAFSLQPGLNVVEVYTNFQPFMLNNYTLMEDNGLRGTIIREDNSKNQYTYKAIKTGSVVYLIDYQGDTTTAPTESTSNTALGNVIALRYGEETDYIGTCPVTWNEDEQTFILTVPESFNANGPTSATSFFTHSVLMLAKPAGTGATADFTSNVNGLINGEVAANCAFLNIEKLYGQADPSFNITVTAADGTTTKTYPVKVIYVSSDTKPGIEVKGPTLDVEYSDNTYAYYLEYTNASASKGTMTVTVPEGAKATVNGTAYTAPITLDPKEDFYRVTITAADGVNASSYYFVTRYADGTMPYTTLSAETEALAKGMLTEWYDSLRSSNCFSSYWRIFMANATGNADGSAYDFNGAYVVNPAEHGKKQATDWAADILEIVMLGYNPYSFPYGENPTFDYVNDGLLKCGGGPYANNVWYHMATTAAGAPQTMLPTIQPNAVLPTYDLDTRAWIIASLSSCYETKDMLYYVDSLHNVQDTSGTYTSLWKNQSWHGASSGNAYTTGCVLSAIASSGADPDRMFAIGDHTPLKTIRDTMYKDGLFNGAVPKDMIIGLGDVLHGSNVWARYTLTEQKYNALIAKAKTLNVNTSSMPETFTQTTACGKAYYDLYDDVYDALVAAGRTAEAKEMRPDVIWGMPQEVFADEVNKMPKASELTADDLADLEKLIEQYEAMDDASRKAVASDVLAKYQALVAKGLSLKAGDNRAANLYKDILALPDAANINDSNKEQTKTSVDAIRKAMSQADEDLLKWAGASVLSKLEAVEQELEDPTEKITVTFTLLGDHVHTETETDVHTLKGNNLTTWIAEDTYQVNPDTTVWDFMQPILEKNGIKWDAGTGDSVYVKSLTYKGETIGEFTNGTNSGWQYTVNGEYPSVSIAATTLKDKDVVIFHYTDDYKQEGSSGGGDKPDPAPSGDKYTDQQISDAYKATGNALALKTPTTGSTNGEWLMLGLARAEHTIDSSSKDAYLRSVRSYINKNYSNGKLSNDKSTENSRIILALTALGEDPQTFVTGNNLLEGYSDFNWTVKQGVAGPIFALLAIDSQKYTVPDYAKIRNDLIKEILDEQNKGGWSADGKTVDVDMTAMAIQALAPYYKTNSDVKDAVDTAISYLILQQNDATGAFPNADGELTAESTAQVIVALTSLGKNPAAEKHFQAGDKKLSPIDGLMRFYQENGKFSHKLDADANDMATEQSYYALVSYYRLKNGKTSLYDMTDLKDNTPESVASVIAKIDAIGSVTEDSYEDIIAAREAYKKLSNADKAQLPDGYLEILENAEKEYAELLANKKTDAKKELNDYYLGIDQKDYGEAGRKKLSEILAKAQRDITSAKSCPQVDSILRQAISDLDAVRKGDITVSFRLIGSLEASQDVNLTTNSYLPEYVTWIPTTKYELASNATVYDLFTEALRDAGLSAIGAEGGYVKTIYAPSCLGGYALSEFTNGKRSGWMYTLNGKHSSNALTDQKLEDGDMVVWHYVNDYSHEVSDWSGDSQHPSLGNGTYYNGWLRAADISPERYVEQLLGKILTVGKNGTVEPKLTLSHLGKSVTFTFKPDKGYRVKDVKVDGKSVGPVASYTVDKLSVSTRIEVTFTNGKLPFTDVRESDWFYDDVVFAYENGLFAGTSDTTFSPNSSMTRAMLVTVLYRLEGQPTVNGRSGFSDVTFNSYYEDAVTWAADNGIVNGTSTSTFSPNANVTREQMAAILYRYTQYKQYNTAANSSLNSFSDHASVSGYAVAPLQWAVAEKLINGSAGKLMPTGNATRAQVAAILHRFVTNVAK